MHHRNYHSKTKQLRVSKNVFKMPTLQTYTWFCKHAIGMSVVRIKRNKQANSKNSCPPPLKQLFKHGKKWQKLINFMIRCISKPHAYLQTMTKTHAKFQKDWYTIVGGIGNLKYTSLHYSIQAWKIKIKM